KDGGVWVKTKLADSSASRVSRNAELKLGTDGVLEGKLTITFTGLEAMGRRLDQRNDDATAHKMFLEHEVKQYIPAEAEIQLTNQSEWTSSDAPLSAEFSLKIPGWAPLSGQHALVPIGLFGATEKHKFEYSARTFPIYFEYLSEFADDITIEIPSG